MSHSEPSVYKILGRAARTRWHSMLVSLNKLLGYRISDRHFDNWSRTKDQAELDRYLDLTERRPDE